MQSFAGPEGIPIWYTRSTPNASAYIMVCTAPPGHPKEGMLPCKRFGSPGKSRLSTPCSIALKADPFSVFNLSSPPALYIVFGSFLITYLFTFLLLGSPSSSNAGDK